MDQIIDSEVTHQSLSQTLFLAFDVARNVHAQLVSHLALGKGG